MNFSTTIHLTYCLEETKQIKEKEYSKYTLITFL